MITENNYEVGLVQVRRTAGSLPEYAIRILDVRNNIVRLFATSDYTLIQGSPASVTKVGNGKIKFTPQVTFGLNSEKL